MTEKPLLIDSDHTTYGYNYHKKFFDKKHYDIIVDRLLEEMSELQKVLLKERRGRSVQDHIKEEFVDVLICLEYLARNKNYDMESTIKFVEQKTDKMIKNLDTGRG